MEQIVGSQQLSQCGKADGPLDLRAHAQVGTKQHAEVAQWLGDKVRTGSGRCLRQLMLAAGIRLTAST
jgi:hypothetical protein